MQCFSVFASFLYQSKQTDHHYTEGWCQLIKEISVAVKTLYKMYNCHLNTNYLHIIEKKKEKEKKDGKKKQEKRRNENKTTGT